MYKIIDEKTTYIDESVVIGDGCTIYPNTTYHCLLPHNVVTLTLWQK